MRKLFLTLSMLCVALVGWSQNKLSKDFTGGVLTITYTGGGVTEQELKDLVGGPAEGIAHHATKIVFNGPFTNKDISDPIDKLIGHVAAPNSTIEVDLRGCSEALCVYNGKDGSNKTQYLPKDNNPAYEITEYDVTPATVTTYKVTANGTNFTLSGLPDVLVPGQTYTGVTANAPNNVVGDLSVWFDGTNWKINLWGTQTVVIETGNGYTYTDNNGVSHGVTANDPNLNADKTKYTEKKSLGTDDFKLGDNFKNKVSKLTFPGSAKFKMIPNNLCENYKKLQEITMPNQIEVVGNAAFHSCSVDSVNWSTGLTMTGGESFHGAAIRTANLTACTALVEIDYESFEDCASLTVVSFPVGSTFTTLGNDAFRNSGLKKVDMSMCQGITEFVYANSAYRQFSKCSDLKEAILPPNLTIMPSADGNQVFIESANLEKVTFTGVARYENGGLANPLIIDNGAFFELKKLRVVNFSNNLTEIRYNAFKECAIDTVNLQHCHELVEIQKDAFVDCLKMKEVHLCSHPKVIRTEAFHNIKSITRVEVHECPNTCMTEVICENRGFEYDITHHQTAALNAIEECALLVFPHEGEVCEGSPYTSAWDFFVGDYKSGTLITQENLLCLYRVVPAEGAGKSKRVDNDVDEEGNIIYGDDGNPKTHDVNDVPFECQYQKGNGWHEFLNVGRGQLVNKGEFLRTYSRTAGDGPCLLPTQIKAYRAVDYKSTKVGWVKDKKNGTHYCTDPSKPEAQRVDADYVMITKDTDKSLYANGNRYSKLTIGGTLYLRPLIAKLANLKVNNKTVPYDDEKFTEGDEFKKENGEFMTHKEWYDSEAIYNGGQLTAVPGGHHYVPENTGVVLYSQNITEDAFLMLPGDEGTDIVYKEFQHTGDRFEQGRLISDNTDDDINMLQGSFGDGWPVAPVYPWVYKNEEDCSGGHYTSNKEFRNFACVLLGSKGDNKNGTVLERNLYGWQRLTPSKLKENRAFAQIPVNRFDNHNEGVDQMPDFTVYDVTHDYENYYDSNEGTTFGPEEMMLLSIFEGESDGDAVVDGIKTVNTNTVNTINDAWYTIQGVRVAQPAKGVYIHNGKKVVIK